MFDVDLGREVHEWPVFAEIRLSVLGLFLFYLPCLYVTTQDVMAAEVVITVFRNRPSCWIKSQNHGCQVCLFFLTICFKLLVFIILCHVFD